MKNTNPKSCGSRLALLALCWVIGCIFTNSASAANGVAPVIVPTGGFAIDGNLFANTPTNGVGDWIAMTNLFPGTGGGVLASNGTPLNATTTFHFVDPYSSGTDTVMTASDNADTDPNAWTWGTNSPPAKEDMNNGLVHIGRDTTNHVWIVVSADHTGTGDADMYFYFLQNALNKKTNGTFTSAGPHSGFTTNDLRLKLNFSGSSFTADQWQTNTSGGSYHFVDVSASLPANRVFTAVNSGNTYVPYGAFGSTNYASGNFVEAAVDFTALIGNINPCATAGFSNIFIVTLHSSGTMSDFIDPIPATLTVGLSADAGPDQTQCYTGANPLFSMNGQVGVGGTPALSTNWSVVSGAATILSPGSLTTGVFVPTTAAGTNVTLRLTITSACSNKTDDVVLTVAASPSSCSITGATTVCPATTNVYSAPAGWPSYVWSITGNGSIPGAADQQTVTVVAGSGCNQNFTLNLGTTNACSTTCSLVVLVTDTNTPSITCSSNLVFNANPGQCSRSNVTYSVAFSDSCSTATLTQTAGLASGSTFPKGVTTNTFVVTDACGNSNTCSFTVTVNDTEPPVITCSTNITANATAGLCTKNVTYKITVSDNCGTVTNITNVPVSGSTFPVGTTTVTSTAVDADGNSNSCSFTVTVVDNQIPAIACPSNIIVAADNGSCVATGVVLGAPVATDNCVTVTVTSNAPAVFPLGTNTVTWTAVDSHANTNTCAQLVIVRDTQAPAITCSSNLALSTDPGRCSRSNVIHSVTFSDNCSGATLAQTAGLVSGATFPKGITTNRFTVTDAGGNTNSCSFTVTVTDNEVPTLTCPADVTVSANTNSCAATGVNLGTPPTGDNCAVASVTSNAPASYPLGTNNVTWIVTDTSGNPNTCTQRVIVRDTQAPVITCPASITVNAALGSCFSNVTFSVTATDNCVTITSLVSSPASGSAFPVGVTTVTNIAVDANGNSNSCTFTVTVLDNQLPAITCPSNITVNAALGSCFSNVTFSVTATDNCVTITSLVSAPASGSAFPVGVTTVTNTAMDSHGNSNSCTFTVTVLDNQLPAITCPGNLTVSTSPGQCFRSNVTYSVTFSDNCPGPLLAQTTGLPSGATFLKGVTTNRFVVTDASGNTNTCSFTVTVSDNESPTIACPADVIVSADTNSCSATGGALGSPTNSDNCAVASVTSNAPSSYPLGTNIVTWTVTDTSGNSNTCAQRVIVRDTQKPVINCPASITVNSALGSCFSNVTFSVTATDNCVSIASVVSSPASGSAFPVGTTTVTNVAVDASGNSNSCTFIVTVLDNQLPVITCPSNLIVNAALGSCFSNVAFSVTATDNCGSIASLVSSPASGSAFPVGVTTVTNTAVDSHGNSNTCSFTVTVLDAQPPAITCPGNLALSTSPGQCFRSNVTYSVTFSDNCPGATLAQTAGLPSSSTFVKGTTTNRFTVTDGSGSSNTCSFTVTISDNESPAITCPADFSVDANSSGGWTNGTLGSPVTTDNCAVANVTNNAAAVIPVGTNVVTWIVADTSGNFNICTQRVIVIALPPTITCPADVTLFANSSCVATGVSLGTPIVTNPCGTFTLTNNAPVSFPLGTNFVTWIVTNTCGKSASCVQRVIVLDNQPPSISCPGNLLLSTDPGHCSRSNVIYTVTFSDNCSGATLAQTAGLTNGATYAKGVTTNRFTATDAAGNTNSCSFTVTIADNEPPSITCPTNITVSADTNSCSATNVNLGAPVTSDNCAVAGVTSNAPASYPLGTNTVTWTVTDTSGNTNSCQQLVIVRDTQAPAISCPGNLNFITDPGQCSRSNVTFTVTFSDNCSGPALAQTAGLASGATFPKGVTTNRFTVTDGSGNSNSCSFTVTVTDNQPPTITCPVDVIVSADTNSCAATGVILGTPATADNCAVASVTSNAPSSYPLGTNTVTWVVTDTSGNPNTCAQLVIVRDTQAPAITCPGNLTLPTDPGQCSRSNVIYIVTFSDNCSGPTLAQTAGLASGATFSKGTTSNRFTVTDGSGNSNTCSFTVTISDNEAPSITCPADVTVSADTNSCSATGVFLGTPVTGDNCAVGAVVSNAPSSYPLGTNTVTWTLSDTSGNINLCQQKVIVRDAQAPAITCPGNLILSTDPGHCSRSNVIFSVAFSDNCSGATLAQTAGLASGATFAKGVTFNRFVATDAAGNTNSCAFTVTVTDSESPTITCPANFSTNTVPGGSAVTNLALGVPVTADNCTVAAMTNNAPAVLPVGTNVVTWIVADTSGNFNTCAQNVIVIRTCAGDLTSTALTNVTICASYAAGFTTVASSHDSIAYTWKFNSQTIAGQTNNSLLLPVVDATNAGLYTVEVRTECATNTRSATLTVLPLPATNPVSYTNTAAITINTFGVATPYGSIITPQCVTNVVRNITVELRGFNHTFPSDVSVLMMSPDGRAVMLMAGAGGGEDVSPGVNLKFADTAIAAPPESDLITTGVYHPSNYLPNLTLPAPVPGRPYSTNLSTFLGADANGPWKLFVYDDSPDDGGVIASWILNIEWQTGGSLLLQNPQLLGNGSFQAEVLVAPGVPNIILCTTNLIQWTPLQTNTFSVYPGIFTDTQSWPGATRFYRAILKP